jgi:hypothetical protein
MSQHIYANTRQYLVSAGIVTLLSLAFAGQPAAAKDRYDKLREDARTCQSFGAEYGTPAYSDCMIEQQRRRDAKQLETLEKMRLTSEIARDGQIMAERARRQRCDRNPDRRECRRR